jgi:hypothetical protein
MALFGVTINMGLLSISDITDYSQVWVNKVPFFPVRFEGTNFLYSLLTHILDKLRDKVNWKSNIE